MNNYSKITLEKERHFEVTYRGMAEV